MYLRNLKQNPLYSTVRPLKQKIYRIISIMLFQLHALASIHILGQRKAMSRNHLTNTARLIRSCALSIRTRNSQPLRERAPRRHPRDLNIPPGSLHPPRAPAASVQRLSRDTSSLRASSEPSHHVPAPWARGSIYGSRRRVGCEGQGGAAECEGSGAVTPRRSEFSPGDSVDRAATTEPPAFCKVNIYIHESFFNCVIYKYLYVFFPFVVVCSHHIYNYICGAQCCVYEAARSYARARLRESRANNCCNYCRAVSNPLVCSQSSVSVLFYVVVLYCIGRGQFFSTHHFCKDVDNTFWILYSSYTMFTFFILY